MIGNQIQLSPFAYYRYYTEGGALQPEKYPITWSGCGAKAYWQPNRWLMVTSSVTANGVWDYDYEPHDLIDMQGLTYYGRYYNSLDDLAAYWTSEVEIKIKSGQNEYIFSNVPREWGEGLSPIILSKKAPNYSTIGFTHHFRNNLIFSYFYGNLDINHKSSQDSDSNEYYSYKSISAHKLEYYITNSIQVNIYELVIYDRAFELNYLNPFMVYYPISRYFGNNDNSQLGIEFIYNCKKNKHFISLFIDEWNAENTFKIEHQNWIAYKIGSSLTDIFKWNNQLNIEYTWSDYRVFANSNDYVNYYSQGYPLGFWAGPHAEEYRIDFQTKLGDIDIRLLYLDIKRGRQTDEMINDAYDKINFVQRYSNGFEHKKIITAFISIELINHLSTSVQIGYLQWKNAHFNPYIYEDIPDIYNINKLFTSIGINYVYNIDL